MLNVDVLGAIPFRGARGRKNGPVRVVVVGGTGNTGTSLLRALENEAAVETVLGVARRLPADDYGNADWQAADISKDDLRPLLRGADCVVHLAWLIQPSRDPARMWLTNVHGSRSLFRAAADAGVRAIVYASSVGAYSPGPKDRAVDESWPTDGIATSTYSRHKTAVERELDVLERERPEIRVVRLRPGFIFQRAVASHARRLFLGPFFPSPLLHPALIPLVPQHPRFRFQAVHADDVADAYRRAIVGDARGAYNVAAEPVLDGDSLADALDARRVRVGPRVARAFVASTWRLRLQPADPGWADLAYGVPLMDVARARAELGWQPQRSSTDALLEAMKGIREAAGRDTPPLTPDSDRLREVATGVGGSDRL